MGHACGAEAFCGSQENEILLSALSLLCGFEKAPETELLRYIFPGTQCKVASSPATFPPVGHSSPFTTGHLREPCLYFHAHYFFLASSPALGKTLRSGLAGQILFIITTQLA